MPLEQRTEPGCPQNPRGSLVRGPSFQNIKGSDENGKPKAYLPFLNLVLSVRLTQALEKLCECFSASIVNISHLTAILFAACIQTESKNLEGHQIGDSR